eukprot:4705205-Pyramimonas_sp.AAC.1
MSRIERVAISFSAEGGGERPVAEIKRGRHRPRTPAEGCRQRAEVNSFPSPMTLCLGSRFPETTMHM